MRVAARSSLAVLIAAQVAIAAPTSFAAGGQGRAQQPLARSGTAPQPFSQRTVSVPQDDAYILGAGDTLDLRFLGLDSNSPFYGTVDIVSDGTASLPLLGPVRLAGLTISQARLWLMALYRRQLMRPELQIALLKPRPLRVAVVGEVARPGVYTLSTLEQSNADLKVQISGVPRLVDAIQKAGGVTDVANLREVVLRRQLPGDPQRYRRTNVDLLALIQEGDMVQNPILFDGDTIRIPKANESIPEALEVAASTLAPQEIEVNVVGEVERPGTVKLPANTPLVQAVLAAGGATDWRASTSNVQLVRINRNGTVFRGSYPLNLNQGASTSSNPPLRNRDTVVVGRTVLAKVSDGLSAIGTPLTGLVNILALVQLLRNANTYNSGR
jgi:polysaccharide export outer membrane protein